MLRWRLWAQQLWRGSEQGWVKEKRGRRVASELRDRTRTQRWVRVRDLLSDCLVQVPTLPSH